MEDVQEQDQNAPIWQFVLVVGAIVAVLGFVAWDQRPWASGASGDDDIGMLSNASPRRDGVAPDFALLDENGKRHQLSDYQGRPVFLNFWAVWCTFCKEEMPDMQRIQNTYGDDIVVIGVNAGDSVDDGEAFVRNTGISYLRLYDTDQDVVDGYLVQAMPTSYFIAPDGSISDAHFGFMVFDQMYEQVERSIGS